MVDIFTQEYNKSVKYLDRLQRVLAYIHKHFMQKHKNEKTSKINFLAREFWDKPIPKYGKSLSELWSDEYFDTVEKYLFENLK